MDTEFASLVVASRARRRNETERRRMVAARDERS